MSKTFITEPEIISCTDIRRRLAHWLQNITETQRPAILVRHDVIVAALISAKDWRLLSKIKAENAITEDLNIKAFNEFVEQNADAAEAVNKIAELKGKLENELQEIRSLKATLIKAKNSRKPLTQEELDAIVEEM